MGLRERDEAVGRQRRARAVAESGDGGVEAFRWWLEGRMRGLSGQALGVLMDALEGRGGEGEGKELTAGEKRLESLKLDVAKFVVSQARMLSVGERGEEDGTGSPGIRSFAEALEGGKGGGGLGGRRAGKGGAGGRG